MHRNFCLSPTVLLLVTIALISEVSSSRAATLNFQLGQESPIDLGTLGGTTTIALAQNDNAQVVGYSYVFTSANIRHAFIWDAAGGMLDLDTPGTKSSFATAINEAGVVAGYGLNDSLDGPGFIWDPANGMQTIDSLGGMLTVPFDINDAGQVTGYGQNVAGQYRAFLWDPASGIQDLGSFGGAASYALGINGAGEVVGAAQDAAGVFKPFLWTPQRGLVDLGVNGWATAINDSSTVTGRYETAMGETHAFVWNENNIAFQTDFETGFPPEITALNWTVQTMDAGADGSYGEHGFSGTQFCVSSDQRLPSSLMLTVPNLGPHASIGLNFMLASINKNSDLDLLQILVDGMPVFQEGISWDNSGWQPGAPVELFSDLQLGYMDRPSGYDKGFNMGLVDSNDHSLGFDFDSIPHSASTLQVEFIIAATKNKHMLAIDDLSILVGTLTPVIDLGTLGGAYSIGRDINDASQVVGRSELADGTSRAFLWDPATGMTDLNDFVDPATGWSLFQGWSINNAGDITGEGSLNTVRGFQLQNP